MFAFLFLYKIEYDVITIYGENYRNAIFSTETSMSRIFITYIIFPISFPNFSIEKCFWKQSF